MARIRSVHPGLFTDEAFASASMSARMLLIGIWTEAWDDGVFEWKPLTLKMKIFPVDNVDVPALLSELEGLGFFRKFDVDGKPYGAVRNFCKFQRPKTPNSSRVLPDDFRTYVGLPPASSEPLPNHFGNASEKSSQMEDGGKDGVGEKTSAANAAAVSAPPPQDLKSLCEEAAGCGYDRGFGTIEELAQSGVSVDERILPVLRDMSAFLRKQGRTVDSWAFFAKGIQDRSLQPKVQKPPEETVWIDAGSLAFDLANKQMEAAGHRPKKAISTNKHGRGNYFAKSLLGRDTQARA